MREELDFSIAEGVQDEDQAKIARKKVRNCHNNKPTFIFTLLIFILKEDGRILHIIRIETYRVTHWQYCYYIYVIWTNKLLDTCPWVRPDSNLVCLGQRWHPSRTVQAQPHRCHRTHDQWTVHVLSHLLLHPMVHDSIWIHSEPEIGVLKLPPCHHRLCHVWLCSPYCKQWPFYKVLPRFCIFTIGKKRGEKFP